jgi:hypothetical protein
LVHIEDHVGVQPSFVHNRGIFMNTRSVAIAAVSVIALFLAGWAATRNRAVPAPAVPALVRSTPSVPAPVSAAIPSSASGSIARIDAGTLRQRIDRGEVVVIDVRDIDSYTASHIAGAIHIPLSRIEGELPWLRGSKPIITYCT